jgi:hypothetical protein
MPAHNRSLFTTRELTPATLHRGFDFTCGAPVLRLPARADARRSPRQDGFAGMATVLYDLAADPGQTSPFRVTGLEVEMRELIRVEMASHEAPPELYTRFDLT